MASASKYKLAMQERQEFLRQQRKLLEEQRADYEADVKELGKLLDRTRQELVGYLLPELDDEALTALQERLSYPSLLPIKRDYDKRLAEIEQRREEMSQLDEIKNSEFMISRVEDQMAEIAEAYTRFNEELRPWTDSTWFHRLEDRGYFGEGYKPSLVKRFFDWRAVSFLMADLESKDGPSFIDSDQLRGHYRKLRSEADPVIGLNDDLVQQQRNLLAVKAEYEGLLTAPQEQVAEMYRVMGEAILDHLHACGEQMRIDLAGQDHHLVAFFKKEIGLSKQIQYLKELMVTRIEAQIESLGHRNDKLTRKITKVNTKLSRGKARFYTEEEVAQMREFKADKWERRQQKLRKIRTRITAFDHHDRGSFLEDFLWWDLITNRSRGDDLYEVKVFHDQYPEWDHRTYRDRWHSDDSRQERREDEAMDGAAAALVAEMVPGVKGDDSWQDDAS